MADTFTPVYDIVWGVSQTLTPTYGIKQHVSGTLSPLYSIRESVSQTLTAEYDILTGVAVSQTLVPVYDIEQSTASQTLAPTYVILNTVAQTLTPTYGIRSAVAQTLAPTYGVRNAIAQTLTPVYNIAQSAVAQTLAPTYDIIQHVAQTLAPSYGILQSVSDTLIVSYNVGFVAGATSTDDNDVILTVYCPGCQFGHAEHEPDSMCFSEDGVTWSSWEDYATTKAYQLAPQTTYPTEERTIYVKFRNVAGDEITPVDDSIDLAVVWDDKSLRTEGGSTATYGTPLNLLFWASSSADDSIIPGAANYYRVRIDSGAWGSWTAPTETVVEHGEPTTYSYKISDFDITSYGPGAHLVEIEARDDDLNVIDEPLGITLSYVIQRESQYEAPVIVSKFGLRHRHSPDVRIVRGDVRRVKQQRGTP